MIGGYAEGGAGEAGRPKWRSVSLQGCPREVRLLLAGPYYFDVDMVNSLPNVVRQLGRRGMVHWRVTGTVNMPFTNESPLT